MKVNKTYEYFYPGVITEHIKILPETKRFVVETELENGYTIRFESDGSTFDIMKNSLVCKNAKEISDDQIQS